MCWQRSFNIGLIEKAAVAVGTTTDGSWAGPLTVSAATGRHPVVCASAHDHRRLQGVRSVPFTRSVPQQTGQARAGWVGQSAPSSVTKAAFRPSPLALRRRQDHRALGRTSDSRNPARTSRCARNGQRHRAVSGCAICRSGHRARAECVAGLYHQRDAPAVASGTAAAAHRHRCEGPDRDITAAGSRSLGLCCR